MKLKKILALLLVGCLTCSIVACGDVDKNSDKTPSESNSADNSESEDASDDKGTSEEDSSENESEKPMKTELTEEDASNAAVEFTEALMSNKLDTVKSYFPYEMTDEDWQTAMSSYGQFESMNGSQLDVSDGVTAKLFFELKFKADGATKMSDDDLATLKEAIESSEMGENAKYEFDNIVSAYNVAVIMTMDRWVDEWTVDPAVSALTDEQMEQIKQLTNDAMKEQSKETVLALAFCVGLVDGEAKIIIFETISEE